MTLQGAWEVLGSCRQLCTFACSCSSSSNLALAMWSCMCSLLTHTVTESGDMYVWDSVY